MENINWQDVYKGDSALVISDNKMGLVIKPYGRKFHLLFRDGTEKTYDASELKFIKFQYADEMANGGMTKPKKRKRFDVTNLDEEYMADGGMMAKGGETINGFEVEYHKSKRTISASVLIPSVNPNYLDGNIYITGFGKDEKEAFNDLKKELEKYRPAYYIVTFQYQGDDAIGKSKPILAGNIYEAEIILVDQFESYGESANVVLVEKMAKDGKTFTGELNTKTLFGYDIDGFFPIDDNHFKIILETRKAYGDSYTMRYQFWIDKDGSVIKGNYAKVNTSNPYSSNSLSDSEIKEVSNLVKNEGLTKYQSVIVSQECD